MIFIIIHSIHLNLFVNLIKYSILFHDLNLKLLIHLHIDVPKEIIIINVDLIIYFDQLFFIFNLLILLIHILNFLFLFFIVIRFI